MNGTYLELQPSTRHCARSGACDGESEQIKILPSWESYCQMEKKASNQEIQNLTTWNWCVTVITYCILLTGRKIWHASWKTPLGCPQSSQMRPGTNRTHFSTEHVPLTMFPVSRADNIIHLVAQDLNTCLSSHRANHIYLLNISNLYVSLHSQQQFLNLAITFFHGNYSNRHFGLIF